MTTASHDDAMAAVKMGGVDIPTGIQEALQTRHSSIYWNWNDHVVYNAMMEVSSQVTSREIGIDNDRGEGTA